MKKNKPTQQTWYLLKEYPKYEINKTGQIRNASTGKLRKRDSRSQHFASVVLVSQSGKYKSVHVDELVADTFLTNVDKNRFNKLIHLDGNPFNCSVDNLRWGEDDSAKQQYLLENGIFKPDEYYTFYPLMEFPDSIYEINKMGQVRNKITHKLLKGAIRTGYLAYTLLIDGKIVFRSAHIMVAKQFIPNPENKPIVNHIDEDKSNPCIDNLEWVTPSENSSHGNTQNRANIARNKPVNEYSLQGEYIRTWRSSTLLAESLQAIYPQDKIYNPLRINIQLNSRNDTIKRPFCNRIFMRYNGDCENQVFKISKHSPHKYNKDLPKDLKIPQEYLISQNDLKVDYIDVLKSMRTVNNGLSYHQRAAIDYAIECITELTNMKNAKQ